MIQLNFFFHFYKRITFPSSSFPQLQRAVNASACHWVGNLISSRLLQRAAAFPLCCLWLAVTSSTLTFQIFWQTEQPWSASAALLYFPQNLPLCLNLQIRAQWAEKCSASWTEVETGDDGNSSQVGEAVLGLPVVTDPNQQGVLLCEGNCEQIHKSVGWWTSLRAYFLLFFLSPAALCVFVMSPFIFLAMLSCSPSFMPSLLYLYISSSADITHSHSLPLCLAVIPSLDGHTYVWQYSSIPVVPPKDQGLSICWLTLHV